MCLTRETLTSNDIHDLVEAPFQIQIKAWARLHKTSVTTTGTRTCTRNLSQLHEIT